MTRCLCVVGIQLACMVQAIAWDGSPNLEPGLESKDVLLFEDFEAIDYKSRWPSNWNGPVGAGVITTPPSNVFAGAHSAFLQAKAGEHPSRGAGEYVPTDPIDDVVYSRLYLRFEDDFSLGTSNQLKLFSFRAGASLKQTYGDAGRRPNGYDKFSVTLAIDRHHDLHIYYYHPGQRGGYGDMAYCDGFFCSASLDPGKWYCLEMMLKTNKPGHDDGEIKAWVDGQPVIKVDKLRFREVEKVKIRRFGIVNYFGGGGRWNTSPQDQRTYIDNFVISRRGPIGCLATR